MVKRSDSAGNWSLIDTARDTYNVANKTLYPDLSSAEETPYGPQLDILSNGFKFRGSQYNTNGATYIWASFAESPFQYARAR